MAVLVEKTHNINEKQMVELCDLLIKVVEDGASIGFLPPLDVGNAREYWEGVLGNDVALLVAKIDDVVVGTVQIHFTGKPNGKHRVEIAKLMVDPGHQRKGIGRLLMLEAEAIIKQKGKSLIVLDTREGDPSNKLYLSLGYVQVGRIPYYAKSANGDLDATIFYYKSLVGDLMEA